MEATTNKNKSSTQGKWTWHRSSRPLGLLDQLASKIFSKHQSLDIPIKIPSHLYVLVNRSVLCNCGIEAENHFLLESLAACQGINSKLVMYFTLNSAFINYLDQLSNLTGFLEFLIIKNITNFVQVLPISLSISKSDSTLLTASSDLKEFTTVY